MVMPALIGGFLRRDTSYINRLNLLALVNTRWAGLFGVALANEPGSLGPMNRGNLRINNRVGSTRSFSKTSKLSLRMNLCFKADPSRAIPALIVYSEGWNKQKGVLQIRFTVIDSVSNISTRGNLDSEQTSPIIFLTSKMWVVEPLNAMLSMAGFARKARPPLARSARLPGCLHVPEGRTSQAAAGCSHTCVRAKGRSLELLVDYITGQYGNSVKALEELFLRVPCLYDLIYRVGLWPPYTFKTYNWSRLYRWGGGKIAEKAKAECNISDIVIKCSDLDHKNHKVAGPPERFPRCRSLVRVCEPERLVGIRPTCAQRKRLFGLGAGTTHTREARAKVSRRVLAYLCASTRPGRGVAKVAQQPVRPPWLRAPTSVLRVPRRVLRTLGSRRDHWAQHLRATAKHTRRVLAHWCARRAYQGGGRPPQGSCGPTDHPACSRTCARAQGCAAWCALVLGSTRRATRDLPRSLTECFALVRPSGMCKHPASLGLRPSLLRSLVLRTPLKGWVMLCSTRALTLDSPTPALRPSLLRSLVLRTSVYRLGRNRLLSGSLRPPPWCCAPVCGMCCCAAPRRQSGRNRMLTPSAFGRAVEPWCAAHQCASTLRASPAQRCAAWCLHTSVQAPCRSLGRHRVLTPCCADDPGGRGLRTPSAARIVCLARRRALCVSTSVRAPSAFGRVAYPLVKDRYASPLCSRTSARAPFGHMQAPCDPHSSVKCLAAYKMIGIEWYKTVDFRLNSQPLVYFLNTTHAPPGPFLIQAWIDTRAGEAQPHGSAAHPHARFAIKAFQARPPLARSARKYYGKLNSAWHYEPHNLRNCCLTNYALYPPIRKQRHFVHIQYRCYSTQDQPHLSCRKNGHQLLPSNSYGTTLQKKVFEWPDQGKLKFIESRVYKQQIELVRIAKQYGKYSDKVQRAQDVMSKSLDFRMVAVQLISTNPSSKTPGVDGEKFENTPEYKINLTLLLRDILIQVGSTYNEASPVRILFIPKANGKKIQIGIPTIRDRALQSLVKLVVEPLIEMDSDIHSYGFRRYRSAKNAVALLRSHLKTDNDMQNKWILYADIEGDARLGGGFATPQWSLRDPHRLFDNINHQWLINNVPLPKRLRTILLGWLQAGSIYHGKYELSLAGTPQGGIISPILANFVLDGLEKAIYDSISSCTKSKERRIVIRRKDGTITRINSHLLVVRFADDFVVLARSKHLIIKYVLPAIKNFLKVRGLKLSPAKTRIFTLFNSKSQLEFLGYVLKSRESWKARNSLIHSGRAKPAGIGLYPNKEKVKEVIKKIKSIITKAQNLTAYTLIAKLNPIIRGWSTYFNIGNCSRSRYYVKYSLYKYIWKWCETKHRRWGRKAIAIKYFRTPSFASLDSGQPRSGSLTHHSSNVGPTKRDESVSSAADACAQRKGVRTQYQYEKFKKRTWTFRGETKDKYRFTESTKRIFLQDVSNTNAVLSSKHYIIPKNLNLIHAYSEDYMKLVDFQATLNLKAAGP